jgi:hypothetical protein
LPTDDNPSVFHRELQKNYGIVPQSPTDLPTNYNPLEFHRELQNNYRIVPQSPTGLLTYNTDGITDGFKHMTKHTHVWHVYVCTNTDGVTDVQYRWNHRRLYAYPEAHACMTRVRLHEYRRIENFGEIFEPFLVRISINFRRYYRRNLMPPTTINVCR